MQALMDLIAAKVLLPRPFLQRHASGRRRRCSIGGATPPVNDDAEAVASGAAGALARLQWPCP